MFPDFSLVSSLLLDTNFHLIRKLKNHSLDRSAIANMCSEYGSLIGYFPLDELTMEYLSHTGRDKQQLRCIEAYMKRVGLFRPSIQVIISIIKGI